MLNHKIFLIIALICIVLYVISLFVNILWQNKENFFDPTEPACPTSGPWWERMPPKQIVSLISGVRFPIVAVTPSNSIRSLFQIPFMHSGSVESSGCISIDDTGTYTTGMCNNTDNRQLWVIKAITSEADYRSVLSTNTDPYSSGFNKNYADETVPIVLPHGVSYGFFMVLSQSKPGIALASNGGNLMVQSLGNFTSQMWDITREDGQAEIAVYDTNDLTQFSKGFTNNNQPIVGINPIMPLSVQAGQTYQAMGVGANAGPNRGTTSTPSAQNDKTINFNINLSADSLASILTGSGNSSSTSTNSDGSTTRDSFQNTDDCPTCPSILTDYIKTNNIPCYGCNL
jgi:hypothetical protein